MKSSKPASSFATYSALDPQEQWGYWSGPYPISRSAVDYSELHREGYDSAAGTVSARARQIYALEELRYKDHIAAGLFAIFLGIFGLHKFYLGYNKTAFVMLAFSIVGGLFTFGLATALIGVISLVEGIIYLMKSQSQFEHLYVVNQRDWF